MLMVVKNQLKISWLSIKYALIREMLNKTTFLTNIIFMVLNNASFIVQWIILYSLKDNVGGYTFKQVLLLWGIASGTYGVAHFFFKKAFSLSDTINTGKLDSYLVQPKNILISAITTDIDTSALGDMIYAYITLFIYGVTLPNFLLFTLSSLSFWFSKSDIIADTGNGLMTNFATYPDGIFKGIVKILLFTLIPVGIVNYIPVRVMVNFDLGSFLIVIMATIFIVILAFLVFYKGLKKYSSSNLMMAKI